jgi:hypothetical protein
MIINNSKYPISDKNYIQIETIKKQIVIGHISENEKNNFAKWTNRLNGNYTKTAPFTINKKGNVYKHFDPIYCSNILGNNDLDKKSIVILLENDGWLIKDFEKNKYINWIGYIYNKPEEIVEKKWRNYFYWAPYTNEQFNSTLELVNKLCEDFYIPKVAISHNTKIDDLDNFSGILYKSNLEKHFTDLSPAWDFEMFKYKLENNEKKFN